MTHDPQVDPCLRHRGPSGAISEACVSIVPVNLDVSCQDCKEEDSGVARCGTDWAFGRFTACEAARSRPRCAGGHGGNRMMGSATAGQGPATTWAEPFGALYWRIRVQSYLLAAAFVAVAPLGYWPYALGRDASALMYVVSPDGEALAVVDRHANRLPTPSESAYIARKFIVNLYELNSPRAHLISIAEAVNSYSTMSSKEYKP